MTSQSSIQKASMSQALSVAKMELKGAGGSEITSGTARKVTTASTKDKTPASKTITKSRMRLKKLRIKL